ncbi:hypothetical protein [Rhizobium leguminosarum]|uniref:hypothetical protein n=1 Tax=Rhizobium leguminosarum TaxID=384 RepID=UPI002E154695|nr:hypothetical protein U8Q02_41935 [Rhizobium leguminosarum]
MVTEGAPGYVASHLKGDGFLLELLRDVRGYRADEGVAIARRFVEVVMANTDEGPEAGMVKAECRSLMIDAYLRAIAYDVGRDSYKEPEFAAWRDEAGAFVHEALADASSHATMTMPQVWLAAFMLGFEEEAAAAWERAHGIRAFQHNDVLKSLKEVAAREIGENGEDFASVVETFMGASYEQTELGNLRPYWDKWRSKDDIKPRTPELEAWLGEKAVPEPR